MAAQCAKMRQSRAVVHHPQVQGPPRHPGRNQQHCTPSSAWPPGGEAGHRMEDQIPSSHVCLSSQFKSNTALAGEFKQVAMGSSFLICFLERQSDKQIFYPLVHSPIAHNTRGWARPKPRASRSVTLINVMDPSTGIILCHLPNYTLAGWELYQNHRVRN